MNERLKSSRPFPRDATDSAVGRRRRGSLQRLLPGPAVVSARSNFEGWVGYRFTTSRAVTVVALSRWSIASNSSPRTVSLRANAGVELASAVINTALVDDGWADTAITPILLPAGQYRIQSLEVSGGDSWHDAAPYTLAAGMTLDNAIFGAGAYADADITAGQAFVPLSLTFR